MKLIYGGIGEVLKSLSYSQSSFIVATETYHYPQKAPSSVYQLYHEPYINPRLDNFPQISQNLRTILWDRLYSHFKDFYSGSERLNNLFKVPRLIHCGTRTHIQFSPSSEFQFSLHLNIFPLLNSNSLFNYLMPWI